LVDFAAACRLDYATSLVAESASASVCPPSVGGESALGTDILEDRQEEFECFVASVPHLVSMLIGSEGEHDAPDIPTPRSYAEAIEGPYSSQWQAAMDAKMASWKFTATYVDEVPPLGANIVSGMWIFRVKRPLGSPPAFKARYVARGFSQQQGVDFFQTFSPTPKMTTLRVLLHVAAQRDYELHSLDFSTTFLLGFTGTTLAALGFAPATSDPSLFLRTDTTLPPFYVLVYVDDLIFATADTEALAHVKSELQKRHTCIDLGELTSYLGLRITRDRAQRTITLTQSHMVQQVLQRFGFTYSSPQSTPLPTGHSLSAPPSDESVEPSGPYPELVGCLMYLMTCIRPDLAYPLSLLARNVAPVHRAWGSCLEDGLELSSLVTLTPPGFDDLATQRSSQGYTFNLGSGSVSWRSTRSSSILSSNCEAEIYAGAMAAQELRWLTYLLTDLGEAPRSPPVLYVDNKAMLALCQEHRLEHRTKHISLRYFLARELQQHCQLCLAYVASQANTAYVFTKALQPWSSLYTLATEPPQVAASALVSASGQVAPPCSCHLLTHETLLWHHRLGHPSLPRLRGMHSCLLVSGLPRSLPPLPPSPAPPCLPCVKGRQRVVPHSSSFPPTSAPLQTLHMNLWGPASVSGQGRERYYLLVVDDYTQNNTVFPLRSKGQVVDVLIPWIRAVRLQLRKRFRADLPVMRLHFDRGGEFSSDLLLDFCRGEGILQSFTLPDSPQQNGIAERRMGLVMEVARTSMIHAAAPHFLWPFAIWYAAHQLNLWPRASLLETSPLSAHAIPCVFLGFVPNMPCRQFYHPTSRRVLPSQNVTFVESVPFYHPLTLQCLAPSGVSQVDPPPGAVPGVVAVDSGVARGTASGGAEPGSAEPRNAETGESGGAEPQGAASSGGSASASPRLSPQQLREWHVWRARLRSGATGAGGVGAAGAGGARTRGTGAARTGGVGGARVGDPTESGAAKAGGSGAGGTGAGGAGVGGNGAGGAGAGGAGAVDPGGTMWPRPYFVPLLQQVLGVLSSTALTPPLLCPPPDQSQPSLQPASLQPAPSPYTEQTGGLTERCEPTSRPASPVRTARRVPHLLPLPVPCTHTMTLRPSSIPLRVPLPAPPESSLPEVPYPETDRARATSPTISRLLATAVTDPSFESASASALVAELLDFAAACRLDYAIALVAESASASPPSVGDAPDIPTPRSYAEAITGPYSSHWQAAMDAEMASWMSTSTYVDEVPPPGANRVDGMWIFRVKRPPGSPPAFKACYVARGFSQRQWVDYFQTFSPTPKMTTLWVLLHVATQRDYELHYLDFSTAFLQGSLHEEIWLCRPPGFTGTTLAALGFAPSTADPSLFLRTDTSLPPFYVLVYRFDFQFSSPLPTPLSTGHSLSAPPSVKFVESSGPYPELVGCLITSGMGLVLGGWVPVVLTGHADASWAGDSATKRSSKGYTFSLGSGSVSWRSTRSSSVLSSSCEVEIYAGAMAAQELRWLTYLLTDLGEQPRPPPTLYVDNKAMIALRQEQRLEHRTKHIAVRYFLARELQ
ncbi:unnamed protein product, partial [Closterium sp. NIES-53]